MLVAPPGFQPFDPHGEVRVYRRNLPHWRQENATYFVTFHTIDSLPAVASEDLTRLRLRYMRELELAEEMQAEEVDEWHTRLAQRTEFWLDQGHGKCPFGYFEHRAMLHEAILKFHDDGKTKNPRVSVGAFPAGSV